MLAVNKNYYLRKTTLVWQPPSTYGTLMVAQQQRIHLPIQKK